MQHVRTAYLFLYLLSLKYQQISEIPDFQVMDFEKMVMGSHGILNGRRCTNPEYNAFLVVIIELLLWFSWCLPLQCLFDRGCRN